MSEITSPRAVASSPASDFAMLASFVAVLHVGVALYLGDTWTAFLLGDRADAATFCGFCAIAIFVRNINMLLPAMDQPAGHKLAFTRWALKTLSKHFVIVTMAEHAARVSATDLPRAEPDMRPQTA